ncbi:hypothetical protein CSX11_20320 [Mycobacterium goodii]|nr:hypothetical protein CSX11_20320 [Mycolicibacterium goodii]
MMYPLTPISTGIIVNIPNTVLSIVPKSSVPYPVSWRFAVGPRNRAPMIGAIQSSMTSNDHGGSTPPCRTITRRVIFSARSAYT